MKVLVIGSGGREHAVADSLSKSKRISELYCAPGNGGISSIAECVDIKATDVDGICSFVQKKGIDFVVVTPDDPLMLGMVDRLEQLGVKAFGPRRNAAVIEGSKVFSKNLMKKYNIPTADFEVFDDYESALKYVKSHGAPIVVKADGLALGKGVYVASTLDEAENALKEIMCDKKFGRSGSRVVIEECLSGREISVLAFTDGKTIKPMVSSQDHKRIYDGNKGPNTGGMGTYAPSPIYTNELASECMERIYIPTIKAMANEGRPFKGVLYFGLMMTPKGIMVIEYNARFGDPETQVVLPLLESDLFDIMEAVADEKLDKIDIKWANKSAVCIIMASGGYPGKYETGFEIKGLEKAEKVFHAGTKKSGDKYLTGGGRVLGVVSVKDNMDEAIESAYRDVSEISFKNAYYRKDIGR